MENEVDMMVDIDKNLRAEQSRAEQSRAEQSRAEQSRAEQSRAEQSSLFDYLQLFVGAIIFVLIFSASTSPLYQNYFGGDSSIFQLIGKYWCEGKVPYMDLFDHKGPLIFLINMLGEWIGCLWGIQVIFLFITLLGVWEISRSYTLMPKNIKKSITFLTLLYLIIFYSEGNMTEEYCLPFLTWSIAAQIAWLKAGGQEHSFKNAFLYGMTFSVCLLTRVTNAVVCGTGVFLIVAVLIYRKLWKNLISNLISGIIGMLLILLPFCIYFSANGCLYDMLYGTIIYNFEYATAETSRFFADMTIKSLLIGGITYFIFISIFLLGLYKVMHRKLESAYVLLMTVATSYVCVFGHSYVHYAMIALPMFPILFCELYEIVKNYSIRKRFVLLLILIYTIIALGWNLHLFLENIVKPQIRGELRDYTVSEEVIKKIPNDEQDSIVFYNFSVSNYLAYDICPCYTYFHHQDWQGQKSKELMNKIIEEYETCEAKWIISPNGACGISDILDTEYEIVFVEESPESSYSLYKKR